MSKPRKDRISTEPSSQGLSNPFAALDVSGLPPGKEVPGTAPAKSPGPPKPSKYGRVVLRRETAHRGGKTVVIVYDFESFISTAYIDDLSRRLRKAVGTGGTTKERTIEIQGEQVERVRTFLEAEGFRVAGVR